LHWILPELGSREGGAQNWAPAGTRYRGHANGFLSIINF
jgi:hypothetical protein